MRYNADKIIMSITKCVLNFPCNMKVGVLLSSLMIKMTPNWLKL